MYYETLIHILTIILILALSLLIDMISWEFMDIEYKKQLMSDYIIKLVIDLDLSELPNIEFYSENPKDDGIIKKGYYSNKTKIVNINEKILSYTKNECVNTLAHEVLHYWQYNKANIGDEDYAIEMRDNIEDYRNKKISSDKDYTEYRTHPIERQARAFAKRFEQRYIIDKIQVIIKLCVELYVIMLISVTGTKKIYSNLRGTKNENRCDNRKSTISRNKRSK